MSPAIMDPTGRTSTAKPRRVVEQAELKSLAGKTLGLLDNGKAHSDHILEGIARALQERFGAGEIVVRARKPSISRPASDETMQELNGKCDLVLVGSGD
jgi:hypothetical protein